MTAPRLSAPYIPDGQDEWPEESALKLYASGYKLLFRALVLAGAVLLWWGVFGEDNATAVLLVLALVLAYDIWRLSIGLRYLKVWESPLMVLGPYGFKLGRDQVVPWSDVIEAYRLGSDVHLVLGASHGRGRTQACRISGEWLAIADIRKMLAYARQRIDAVSRVD